MFYAENKTFALRVVVNTKASQQKGKTQNKAINFFFIVFMLKFLVKALRKA